MSQKVLPWWYSFTDPFFKEQIVVFILRPPLPQPFEEGVVRRNGGLLRNCLSEASVRMLDD